MKKIIMVSVILVLIAVITVEMIILNVREKKDFEYTGENTNRKLGNKATFYEKYVKRGLDILVAFVAVIVTAPIVAVISLLIYKEDPGNVIFEQKRVGINKSYFNIHKLRSMKQNTGDIPTHLLGKNEQENKILRVGRFIRKTSIDEIPQFVDILRGRMSLIGPRPALWNQDDLIMERDKYGANDVRPGLTGWAQINGRDSISIETKAAFDGTYKQELRRSSFSGFKIDCQCFWGTIKAVLTSDGVVEGGMGAIETGKKDNKRHYTDNKKNCELIGNIGFGEPVEIDRLMQKKILITGAGSYIGKSFIQYVSKHYSENFEIEELDMLNDNWRKVDFSPYDIVYHVAGIAHADVGNASEEIKQKYYEVNTDLAIEVAKKAQKEGVKEFVFMSSMIIYGESFPYSREKIVTAKTIPHPSNFYGDSKLQADVAIRDLANDAFKVIILRPPMIYGKESKGNYRVLSKLSKNLFVFPNVNNQRSMLYIENLCEFLCQIMLIRTIRRNAVILIPQNKEWTKTCDMVNEISKANGKKIAILKIMKPAVLIGSKCPGKIGNLVNKAFGNNCYAHELSQYEGVNYQQISLKESIAKIEGSKNDREHG